MNEFSDAPSNEDHLIKRVGAFMRPLRDYRKEPVATFREWLSLVFTEFYERRTGAAFAPFNDRFEGRRDFPEAFSRFVDDEVRGQRVGKFSAHHLVVTALAGRLSESLRDPEPFDIELNEQNAHVYVSDFPMLLFQALRFVDMERACEWAANAVRSSGGFAERWTLSEQPFPVALYYEMRGGDLSGPNRRAFNDALLEWCARKWELEGIGLPSFSVMLDVLRGQSAQGRVKLVDRSQWLIHVICDEIQELDQLKNNDDAGLIFRAKKFRDAFGEDGAEQVGALDKNTKELWSSNPLLVYAFSKELAPPVEGSPSVTDTLEFIFLKYQRDGGLLCDA